jgi:4-phytase/acid phosphatase
MISRLLAFAGLLLLIPSSLSQTTNLTNDKELKFVIYLSRHGIRSPTGKSSQYNIYSVSPWPDWDVPPGYLTKHGYHVMELFGVYDRAFLAKEGLLTAAGCADASKVTFYADSDQRTRETGKALAEGLFPGCNLSVQSLPEGTNDPLFHPGPVNSHAANPNLAVSAIAGRIGNNPGSLTEAHRTKLESLDKLLATCGAAPSDQKRASLFDIEPTLAPGKGDRLADLHGPLNTASTLTENFLLEYAEGMELSKVGWGCVDGATLRSLLDLHTAASDFTQRTPAVAKMQASNLLDQIHRALEQTVTGRSIPGTVSKPADKALFLIGHDTNISNIAGLLNMTWIMDGRRDDTPPGGALIIELSKSRTANDYSVNLYYTAQTLEQMRSGMPLSEADPPQRVPIFLSGCSRQDFSCSWPNFMKLLQDTIEPHYVSSAQSKH